MSQNAMLYITFAACQAVDVAIWRILLFQARLTIGPVLPVVANADTLYICELTVNQVNTS